jgi:pteridine reductase
MMIQMKLTGKTALITGAAKRLGAETAKTLHQNGANIIIHYASSAQQAEQLEQQLNMIRPASACIVQADLRNNDEIHQLADQSANCFEGLDILVNNASTFYPTPLGQISEDNWDDLMGTNFKAGLFLSQACYPALKHSKGCIINMLDIHASSPLKDYTLYCCAKAASTMLTRSLALEMGPDVRVNGVAPGAILWPENDAEMEPEKKQNIIQNIPLNRTGQPRDIADTILFLASSDYINGQIIAVDGGRNL